MGKVIEFSRKERGKLPEGFWQQDYLLFSDDYNIKKDDLPPGNKMPAGAEITLHPGNDARLLVNEQLLRMLALSPRDIREAVFITAQKILRFRYVYRRPENFLPFTNFIKIVSNYVNRFGSMVLDNNGLHCWFPEKWLKIMDSDNFDFKNHLTLHSVLEKESDRYWIHTHGMVQFGCPDLEIRMVSSKGMSATLKLISRLSCYLIKNGPVFKEGCRIAILRGLCWVTFKHCREIPGESHYRNNYYRIFVTVRK
ncbi:MAG: hypothetical protein K6U74_04635 [Firmicutes bacterium]|nr:hypothetical protein [Bacillota bacterium]